MKNDPLDKLFIVKDLSLSEKERIATVLENKVVIIHREYVEKVSNCATDLHIELAHIIKDFKSNGKELMSEENYLRVLKILEALETV